MRRVFLLLALPAALAVHAAARAGGGEGYSGSSSGSSSYSFDGGSGASGDLVFSLLYLFLRFVAAYPLFGLPLTVCLAYMAYLVYVETNAVPGVFPPSGGAAPREGPLRAREAEELARLRARDPAFDEHEFLRRAGAAFLKIQEAWSAGEMARARAFLSDGVYERFECQLADLKSRGLRNLMEGVQIRGSGLLACRSDKHFDALWVRIAASASDRMVDAAGNVVSGSSGSSGSQPFEEVWTFLRRPGAKTLKHPGLIEGSCPSCGAPLSIADAAQCAACRTWVNSGEYDWVLAEITQSCEWVLREPARDVDGWPAASSADPALSLPALEDRVSVIFWRWFDALRKSDPGSPRGAAVGAVEVVAFEEAGDWLRAHILVKWSADGELRRHFFVLSRARGAKTDARQGLRTARCPSCGAPSSARSEAACGYCGVALNDGKKDWVLTEVVPFGLWKRPAVPVRAQPARVEWGAELSAVDAFAALASAALADGEESLAEKAFLDAYAKSRGLPPAKAGEIVAAARAGRLDVPRVENAAQAESLLRGMIRVSLADGVVAEEERTALQSFAVRFGLRSDDVAAMIVEEREAPGRAARGALSQG